MKKVMVVGVALLVAAAFAGSVMAAGWFANGEVTSYVPGKSIKLKSVLHSTDARDVNDQPLPPQPEWTFVITPKTKVQEGVAPGMNVRIDYEREGIPVKTLTATAITITKKAAKRDATKVVAQSAPKEGTSPNAPVLEKVWASPEANYGDIVKIYIKATDKQGDMRFVLVSAGQKKNTIGATMIRIKKPARKDLNGYIWWDSSKAVSKDVSGVAEISIEDWKGNESKTVVVPLKLMSQGAKVEPKPAEFQENESGPIMIETTRGGGQ